MKNNSGKKRTGLASIVRDLSEMQKAKSALVDKEH